MKHQLFCSLIKLLTDKLKGVPEDHGVYHCITVMQHAERALTLLLDLKDAQREAVQIACLLHEVDDRKFFPSNSTNALDILRELNYENINLVMELIGLVSCSKNRNNDGGLTHTDQRWKLIPRDADRLEALGPIGIYRCFIHTVNTERPERLPSTPAPITLAELTSVATPARFAAYQGESVSMIDHFYDKVLHIGIMSSGNSYLQSVAHDRMKAVQEFIISHNRSVKA